MPSTGEAKRKQNKKNNGIRDARKAVERALQVIKKRKEVISSSPKRSVVAVPLETPRTTQNLRPTMLHAPSIAEDEQTKASMQKYAESEVYDMCVGWLEGKVALPDPTPSASTLLPSSAPVPQTPPPVTFVPTVACPAGVDLTEQEWQAMGAVLDDLPDLMDTVCPGIQVIVEDLAPAKAAPPADEPMFRSIKPAPRAEEAPEEPPADEPMFRSINTLDPSFFRPPLNPKEAHEAHEAHEAKEAQEAHEAPSPEEAAAHVQRLRMAMQKEETKALLGPQKHSAILKFIRAWERRHESARPAEPTPPPSVKASRARVPPAAFAAVLAVVLGAIVHAGAAAFRGLLAGV